MSRYRYTYLGTEIINLPEHGVITDPNQPEKIYETNNPIVHPLFQPLVEKDEHKKGK